MSDLTLDVAYGIGRKKNITHWRNDTVTWDEVVGWVEGTLPTTKERAGSYVFGSLVPTPHVNHTVTGCPADCNEIHRNKVAVRERSAFTLDVDDAPLDFPERVKALGAAALLHTTAHSTPHALRLRLIVPTDRPMTPKEFRQGSDQLMRALSRDGDPEGLFDDSCSQPERLMYRPSGTSVQSWVNDEPLLGVDALLIDAAKEDKGVRRDEPEKYYDDSPPRDPALGIHRIAKADIDAALARLDGLPHPWVEGESFWDTTTFEVACILVRHANSGWTGYTLEQAEADLHDHAPTDDVWGDADNAAKWTSARNAVDDTGLRVRRAPEEEFDRIEVGSDESGFEILDLRALLDPERPQRRWLWGGLVPTGDQASIVAPGGTGKSLLVLGLCLAAASGEASYIGRMLDFDGRVFYLDMENSEDDWIERLLAFGWTRETVRQLAGRFLPLSLPALAGLDTKAGSEQLKRFLLAHSARKGDLLVLDSMQRVTEGEENNNDTLRALYNYTSTWLKARGITVIRTDNTGKDEEKGARGASAKRDDVGYSHLLKRVGANRFRLTSTKHRSAGGGDDFTFERTTDERGSLAWLEDHAPADSDFRPTGLMEQISIALEAATVPLTTNLVTAAVKGRAVHVTTALDALIEDGYVRRDKGTNRAHLHTSVKPYRAADDLL